MFKEARIGKKRAGYIELEDFKNSDLNHGYFCYNCAFFINAKGGRCLIVRAGGKDIFENESKVIAPHGYCPLWEPNWAIIRRKDK